VPLLVRPLPTAEALAFLTSLGESPHQQWPSWAQVKAEWGHELLGWFDGPVLVGTGLVLRRRLRPTRWSFDYLPEGPVLDWARFPAADVVTPLVEHLRGRGAVTVKLGARLRVRRWTGPTLLEASRAGAMRWRDVPPDVVHTEVVALGRALGDLGARPYEAPAAGFGGTMQPRYGIEVPLLGRSVDDLRQSASSSFRRNVAKADRAG
jgi:hypothetical protein